MLCLNQAARDSDRVINYCTADIHPGGDILINGRWHSASVHSFYGDFCCERLPCDLPNRSMGAPTGFAPSLLSALCHVPHRDGSTQDSIQWLAGLALGLRQRAPWNPLLEASLSYGRACCALPYGPVLISLLSQPAFRRRFLSNQLDTEMQIEHGLTATVTSRPPKAVHNGPGRTWLAPHREQCMAMLLIHAPWLLPPLCQALADPLCPQDVRQRWLGAAARVYVTFIANGSLHPLRGDGAGDDDNGDEVCQADEGEPLIRHMMHRNFQNSFFRHFSAEMVEALLTCARRTYGFVRAQLLRPSEHCFFPFEPQPDATERSAPLITPPAPSLSQLYRSLSAGTACGTGSGDLEAEPQLWARFPLVDPDGGSAWTLSLEEAALTVSRILRQTAGLCLSFNPIPEKRRTERHLLMLDEGTIVRRSGDDVEMPRYFDSQVAKLVKRVRSFAEPLAADVGATLSFLEEQLQCARDVNQPRLGTEEGYDQRAWVMLSALRSTSDHVPGAGAVWPALTLHQTAHWALLADALQLMALLPDRVEVQNCRGEASAMTSRPAAVFFASRWGSRVEASNALDHIATAFPHWSQPAKLGEDVHQQIARDEWSAGAAWDHGTPITFAPWRLESRDSAAWLRRTCPLLSTTFAHLFFAYLQREGPSPLSALCSHRWRRSVVAEVLRSTPRYRSDLVFHREDNIVGASLRKAFSLSPTSSVAALFRGEEGRGDGVTRGWYQLVGEALVQYESRPMDDWLHAVLQEEHWDEAQELDYWPLFYAPGTPGFWTPLTYVPKEERYVI